MQLEKNVVWKSWMMTTAGNEKMSNSFDVNFVISRYLTDRALDISDNWSVWVVEKLYSYLGNVTGVTSATKNLINFGKLHWLILRYKFINFSQLELFLYLSKLRFVITENSQVGTFRSLSTTLIIDCIRGIEVTHHDYDSV
jgi:hypothetical protein